jgi:hypothetical protein
VRDKSAPTDIRGICLNLIIGGVREVLIRAPLRFAEAPTGIQVIFLNLKIGTYGWPEYLVNVH